jgi:hypothetical protein
MSWKDGDFSKELLEDVKLELAIGKNIVCDDGITRNCKEIVCSFKYPWKAIINEQDPDSKAGHFVNILALSAQILGKPMPSKDAQEAFTKVVRLKFNVNEDGTFDSVPEKRKSYFSSFVGPIPK